MANRWMASYDCLTINDTSLEHYGRVGMKWGQHIFAKDPAAGRKYIDKKRKALSANVALAKDAARRGKAKQLAKLNAKTKKMAADVKQLEEMYEEATGQKYTPTRPGEAEEAERKTKEESKAAILKSGSAADVFSIKDQLTQSEMQDAINRIQKENQLAALKSSEVQQKINNAANFTKTVINAGGTAVDAFNTYEKVAKMVNTISGEDTLPVFTGRKEKADKDAEKARAKKVKAIIEKSDAQEIADNIHLFTNDEVLKAKQRLDNYANIKKQAAANEKEKADAAAKKIADAAKEAKAKAAKEAAIKESNEKKFSSYLSEWDDFLKEDSKAKSDTMKIVEDALKDFDRATRGKGKATAETYGLDKVLTPSFEDKASKWISSFINSEDKEIETATKELEKAFKSLVHTDISDDELYHYGRKGMKWYQNIFTEGKKTVSRAKAYAKQKKKDIQTKKYKEYDASLSKVGSNVHGKTRYTNIDGSLNERGKLHSQKYINKEQEKNRKYYDKQIAKYKKLQERYKDDPELKKKFDAMIKDAEASRDGVNTSIGKFGIQEILANETEARNTALKVAGAVASGALLGSGAGIGVPLAARTITSTAPQVAAALKGFDMNAPMDTVIKLVNTTEIGRKGEQAAQTAIRTYSDARAYVAAIYMDQMFNRLDESGISKKAGDFAASGVNYAIAGIDKDAITGLGNTATDAITQIINNATTTTIKDAGALNKVYGNMDYNHINILQAIGNMNTEQQTAILMNDPNYLRLVNQISNAGRKTPNALNPH